MQRQVRPLRKIWKMGLLVILFLPNFSLLGQRGQGDERSDAAGWRSAAGLLQETVERLGSRQYQAAEQLLGSYLQLYPKHYRTPEANFYRAVALYHLGRYQESRAVLNTLLIGKPRSARRFGVLYWLGLLSYRLGEVDTAYDLWLRQLAVREPEAADYLQQAYLGLAQILVKRDEGQDALRYFRLLQGRTKYRAGFSYGSLALKLGLYREAYNAFSAYLIQENIAGGPARLQAMFYQGEAAFFAGLLPQAKQSLDAVLRLYNSKERLFFAALLMRLRIAVHEGDKDTGQRFYDEAVVLSRRYRHGLDAWFRALELPLFMLQKQYVLALKHLRGKLARSRGQTEKEIVRFDSAVVQSFLDVRYGTRSFEKLRKSFLPGIRERAQFHAARLQVSFPLTRSKGMEEMEQYLVDYPEGVYSREAAQILVKIYRSDPERFWLPASVLLEKLVESPDWGKRERARFYLYWAEMARQLGHESATLRYLHQAWKLAGQQLVGMHAYYRSGAIYFSQQQYSRSSGYFRAVQLQLSGMKFAAEEVQAEAAELRFYADLALAQSYAGAGRNREALQYFQELVRKSRNARLGRNAQRAQLQLGLVYFYQKAYRQAVETFDSIIAQGSYHSNQAEIPPYQYPPSLMAFYWKGEALFRQGLFAAARQSFRRVNEIYPEALGPKAYLRAALAAQAAEDYQSVIQDLEQAQLFAAGDLQQLLNIDFNLVKYNLLLGLDAAAIAAANHLLKAIPPAYNFLGEAFMEVAELYFNRGDLVRSKAVLAILEKEFIRPLPPRERKEDRRLELYLEEYQQGNAYASSLVTDPDLNANLGDKLFSFDTERFLQRYNYKKSPELSRVVGNNAAGLESNLKFYIEDAASSMGTLSTSIFAALYLQGILYLEEQDYLTACKYFLQYLKKDPRGSYAVSAASSVLRLMPELETKHRQQLFALLQQVPLRVALGDALGSILLVRYWSLQEDSGRKKRELEKIVRRTLSINARKEALYHLAVYYRRKGDLQRAERLLLELRSLKGGNLALDPENYWAGLANLELGRTAHREGRYGDARVFLEDIVNRAQVERETLAEALYWLASIAHFEGDSQGERRYRQSLQNLAPDSKWLRKLD